MWTTNKELGACLIASVHENKCAWSRDKVLPNISTTELNIYTHTKKKKSENNKATKNDESCFQGKTLEHFLHFSSVFYENHLKGVLNITKHSDIQSDLDLISLIENCTFSSDLVLKMLEMNFFLAHKWNSRTFKLKLSSRYYTSEYRRNDERSQRPSKFRKRGKEPAFLFHFYSCLINLYIPNGTWPLIDK